MTILNTIPIYDKIYYPHFTWAGLFVALSALITLIIIIVSIFCEPLYTGLAILGAIVFLALGLISYLLFTRVEYQEKFSYNEYVVQVNETTDMQDFNDKYEVLEWIGTGVYRVKERKN